MKHLNNKLNRLFVVFFITFFTLFMACKPDVPNVSKNDLKFRVKATCNFEGAGAYYNSADGSGNPNAIVSGEGFKGLGLPNQYNISLNPNGTINFSSALVSYVNAGSAGIGADVPLDGSATVSVFNIGGEYYYGSSTSTITSTVSGNTLTVNVNASGPIMRVVCPSYCIPYPDYNVIGSVNFTAVFTDTSCIQEPTPTDTPSPTATPTPSPMCAEMGAECTTGSDCCNNVICSYKYDLQKSTCGGGGGGPTPTPTNTPSPSPTDITIPTPTPSVCYGNGCPTPTPVPTSTSTPGPTPTPTNTPTATPIPSPIREAKVKVLLNDSNQNNNNQNNFSTLAAGDTKVKTKTPNVVFVSGLSCTFIPLQIETITDPGYLSGSSELLIENISAPAGSKIVYRTAITYAISDYHVSTGSIISDLLWAGIGNFGSNNGLAVQTGVYRVYTLGTVIIYPTEPVTGNLIQDVNLNLKNIQDVKSDAVNYSISKKFNHIFKPITSNPKTSDEHRFYDLISKHPGLTETKILQDVINKIDFCTFPKGVLFSTLPSGYPVNIYGTTILITAASYKDGELQINDMYIPKGIPIP